MFSENDLQALLDYSSDGQILSLYLNTDPTEVNTEAAKLRLRNLLKNVELPEDVQAVQDFANLDYDWTGRGLVLFSNQKNDFFEAYSLGVSVPDQVHVGERPTLRPLVRLLDTFSGWGVVLVDKQGAHLFSFNLGELTDQEGVLGEEVKQTKRGGGNAMPGRMGGSGASGNVEKTIERNIKEVIDFATDFFKHHHIRRIMIGGTDDNIARFKEELPKSWQSLVVGAFPMSITSSHTDVLSHATREALKAEEKRNQQLISEAITLAAKGSNGVTGLIDTLNAIHEGRVKTLLVIRDFEKPGYRCTGCGYLTIQTLEKCPFCSGNFETIQEAVELAVQTALQKGADVKVITENDALSKAGQIAAILRY
jgi:peptide chain release factor subunit 1